MGSVLSADEKRRVSEYVEGFNAAGLTAVIWDSINQVGLDDIHQNLGIQFDTDDAGYSRVVFWSAQDPPLPMPRKVFLEILLFISSEVFKNSVQLTKSSDESNRLALAIAHLQQEIDSCPGETAAEHRQLLADGHVLDNLKESVEEVRVPCIWANNGAEVGNWSSVQAERRRSTKGIVGVVERLPELRKRYEASTITRIRNKLKAIFLFWKNIRHHEVTPKST